MGTTKRKSIIKFKYRKNLVGLEHFVLSVRVVCSDSFMQSFGNC